MPNPTLVALSRLLNARKEKFSNGFDDLLNQGRGAIGNEEQMRLYLHPAGPLDGKPTYAVKSPDGTEWLSFDNVENQNLSWRPDEPGQPGPWEMFRRDDPANPQRLVSVQFPNRDFYVIGEWPLADPPKPDPKPAPDVAIAGETWTNRGKFWSPTGISMLSPFSNICTEDDWIAFFEYHVAAGIDAVRIFCGALMWDDRTQLAAGARDRMPAFFDMAEDYGVAVWAVLVTDSKDGGYDVEEHLRLCSELTNRPHVIPVLANEWGHPTQSDEVTPENLRRWGQQYFDGQPWSIGAPVDGVTAPPDAKPRPGQQFDRDEPTPVDWQDMDGPASFRGFGGPSMDAHLDRGRDGWDQPRRVREIYACTECDGCPCLNAEPGRDETGTWFYAVLGALDRCFSNGGIHHCEHGLQVRLPNDDEAERLDAYVQAHKLCDAALAGQRGGYYNSGHADSPVGTYSQEIFDTKLCRHYAFTNGNIGVSPVIGVDPSLELNWANGWQPVKLLKAWTRAEDGKQLQLWQISRGARGRKRKAA